MKCPNCSSEMNNFRVYTTYIDRCDACNAIWLDLNEMNELLKIKAAKVVDLGTPKALENYKKNQNPRCPKCDVKLFKMSYPGQAHIEIDKCGSCHGVLLDGGELKDIQKETLFEYVSTFLKITTLAK